MKFHRMLCAVSRWVFTRIPYTRVQMPSVPPELFDRPSVIIANHQSHLDLIALLMLSPRIVVITNTWAWNLPFYRSILRFARFIPIDNLLTDDLSALEERIREGFSIVIFPEGTRTEDGRIGRFHKGAFYLAGKYGLPVLPVLLHGFNDVLPKQDLLLRPGRLTLRLLDPIPPDQTASYQAMAKAYREKYVQALRETGRDVEHAGYYTEAVIARYRYKPARIFRTVRRFFRTHTPDYALCDALPYSGRMLVCDHIYGAGGLWMSLLRQEAEFDVLFEDQEHQEVAMHCTALPANFHIIRSPRPTSEYAAQLAFTPDRPVSVNLTVTS